MLFLSSVYQPRVDKQCLGWLWIISNEIIFFVILVVVFYFYRKKPKYGYISVIVLLCGSIIASFTEGIVYNFMYGSKMSLELDAILFIHPYNACQGYLLGILYALIWFAYRNQKDNTHIPKNTCNLNWDYYNAGCCFFTFPDLCNEE